MAYIARSIPTLTAPTAPCLALPVRPGRYRYLGELIKYAFSENGKKTPRVTVPAIDMTKEELPQWVVPVIVILALVIVAAAVALYLRYRHVQRRREERAAKKMSLMNSEVADGADQSLVSKSPYASLAQRDVESHMTDDHKSSSHSESPAPSVSAGGSVSAKTSKRSTRA